jgi:pimeloyl-ACP methyl ester carboxylesterase
LFSTATERISDVIALPDVTVVLVHGAWADGSSWKDVILGLEQEGLGVIAAPIPLTSLSDDSAALKRAIARTQGPVIRAGHAYAGAVIATINDERLKALVYIAALAPEQGEIVAQVFYRDERHPQATIIVSCSSRTKRRRSSYGGTSRIFS